MRQAYGPGEHHSSHRKIHLPHANSLTHYAAHCCARVQVVLLEHVRHLAIGANYDEKLRDEQETLSLRFLHHFLRGVVRSGEGRERTLGGHLFAHAARVAEERAATERAESRETELAMLCACKKSKGEDTKKCQHVTDKNRRYKPFLGNTN